MFKFDGGFIILNFGGEKEWSQTVIVWTVEVSVYLKKLLLV